MNASTSTFTSLLTVGLAAAVTSFASAQDFSEQIRRAHGLQAENGRVVGGGPDYMLELDGRGAAFTPAFGANVPRTLPLRFTLESIRYGANTVFVPDAERAPTPRLGDGESSAFIQHTDDIREVYDVRVEGVEQSFVFNRRLSGAGELVVRGRVDTELTADRLGESAGGFRFSSAHGAVEIGAVTGIDARGVRAAGSLRYDGTHLDLVLPAAFMADATYPLVLDPLIGVDHAVGGSSTFDDGDSDVAYDATNDEYCVVWSRAFSNVSQQIRAQRFDSNGNALGGIRSVTLGGVNVRPTIANVNATNRYLIAWQHATGGSLFGPHDIMARAMNPLGGNLSGIVTIAATTADEVEPDAGNENTLVDDDALIVWSERGNGIRGMQVRLPSGTGDPVPSTVRTLSTGDDHAPAISKGGGPVGRHCVVWHRQLASTAVYALIVDRNMNALDHELAIAFAAGIDEERADVDGNGARFMVAYERQQSSGSTLTDIYCRTVTFDGTNISRGPAETAVADASIDERTPAVGFCGPKYVVAWAEQALGFANYDIVTLGLGRDGCTACGVRAVTTGTRAFDSLPEIATQYSSGAAGGDDAYITFSSSQIATGTIGDIRVQRFSAIGAGGPVTSLASSCGTGGTLTINGSFALGNLVSFELTGADPVAQVAVLHIGAAQTLATCGTCSIVSPFVAIPVTIQNGAARVPMNIDCSQVLVGDAFYAQFALAFGSTTPCALAPTVSLSNPVSAQFGY